MIILSYSSLVILGIPILFLIYFVDTIAFWNLIMLLSLLLVGISFLRKEENAWLKRSMLILGSFISLYMAKNVYELSTGEYILGTELMYINGQLMEEEDKEIFLHFLKREKTQHAHVTKKPDYGLSYEVHSDLDPRHLHVFREEKLVYSGSLLGLETGGLELDGYLLTKETDILLEAFDSKYKENR